MINITDIQERIKADFDNETAQATELINTAVASCRHLNDPRLIRCILFLTDKNIAKLKICLESAITDPHDIILWAEYIQSGPGDQTKRVRDFNKSFEQSEIDVRE